MWIKWKQSVCFVTLPSSSAFLQLVYTIFCSRAVPAKEKTRPTDDWVDTPEWAQMLKQKEVKITHTKISFPVPHLDVFWYCLNGMGTQKMHPKRFLSLFFPYICHVKTKSNIVYEYLKQSFFKETQIPFPKCIEH